MRPILFAVGLCVAAVAVAKAPPKPEWQVAIERPAGTTIVTLMKEGSCTGDDDGWSSALVSGWLQGNPDTVVVAAPFRRDASDILVGDAFQPAVMALAYKDGVQVDRVCGCQSGPDIAAWLGNIASGTTRGDAVAASLGDTVDGNTITRWLDVVQMHYCGNRLDDAFAVAKMLWEQVPPDATELRATRLTRIVHDMGVLAAKDDAIREQVVALRDGLDAAKDSERAALDDWVALNRILRDDDRTIAWFDTVKDDPAKKELTAAQAPNLFYMLAERGKWADAGRLVDDPIAWLAIWKQQTGGLETAAWGYAALLAADRAKDAAKLAKEILRVAPPSTACQLLAKSTEVGATDPSQKPVVKTCDDPAVTAAWAAVP
ncbi:MAG: hypothetical protein H6733_17775 [Alphaproteobacteria bacterium]|nr:hypothetical protein [Alphaproteobacteria bacterium]